MTDPLNFASKSPRFGLPLLFAGQAQKEFTVNEAHALIDLLLHPVLEGQADAPPSQPQNGECWLVGGNPTGEWVGHEFQIASYQDRIWVYATPRDGMRLLDRSTMQDIFYRNGLRRAVPPEPITGGATVDQEARRAIEQLIAALVAGGILALR
jgi:hypothetical protein